MQNNWTLKTCQGTSLVVQWLRCWASSARGLRWIPGWRIKILCVPLWGKKKKSEPVDEQSLWTATRPVSQGHTTSDGQSLVWTLESLTPAPRSYLVSQRVKNLPATEETQIQSLGQEDPLEEEMATHSSIVAWRIPWTEEPGGLQFKSSKRVRGDHTNTFTFFPSS